jgi:hypothetical protein
MGVEVYNPPPDAILKISAPCSSMRFEWHPRKKRVYMIRLSDPTIGEPIAFEINDHGAAWNAVLIYLRGYREGEVRRLGNGSIDLSSGQYETGLSSAEKASVRDLINFWAKKGSS